MTFQFRKHGNFQEDILSYIPYGQNIHDQINKKGLYNYQGYTFTFIRIVEIIFLIIFSFSRAKLEIFSLASQSLTMMSGMDHLISQIICSIVFCILVISMNIVWRIIFEHLNNYIYLFENGLPIHEINSHTQVQNTSDILKNINNNLYFDNIENQQIKFAVSGFMKNKKNKKPALLLLSGIYGTGKTEIAKYICRQSGAYVINLSQLIQLNSYGLYLLDKVIALAKKEKRVLFFDDGDIGLMERYSDYSDVLKDTPKNATENRLRKTLRALINRLLVLTDTEKVPVVVTMNTFSNLNIDEAFLRRITHLVNLGYQPLEAKREVILKYLNKMKICVSGIEQSRLIEFILEAVKKQSNRDIYSLMLNIKTQSQYFHNKNYISINQLRKLVDIFSEKNSLSNADINFIQEKHINYLHSSLSYESYK